jgi:hypothetical protein
LKKVKKWFERFLQPTPLCTAIIAVCTIVYTYTMWQYTKATYDLVVTSQLTLATSRQANAISQKTFYMQERPWLFISGIGDIKFDEIRKIYKYTFSTINSGSSPARHIRTIVTTIVDNVAQNEQPYYEATIFPNRNMQTPSSLNGQQYLDIKGGLRKIEIFVFTQYTDLENIQHFTKEKLSINDGGRNIGINSVDIDSNWLFAIIWAESKSLHNRLISFFSGCVHFAIQRPGVESA